MSFYWRLCLAASLVAVLAARPATAAHPPAGQTMEVVKQALEKHPETPDHAAVLAAAAASDTLLSIRPNREAGISLHFTGTPAYKIGILDKGRVLALDIENAIYAQTGQELTSGLPLPVASVRTELKQLAPRLVTRVSFGLAKGAKHTVEHQASRDVIRITAGKTTSEIVLDFASTPLRAQLESAPQQALVNALALDIASLGTRKANPAATAFKSEEDQVLDSLLSLKAEAQPQVYAAGPVSDVAQQLREVAAVKIDLNTGLQLLDAAQNDNAPRAFDTAGSDTDSDAGDSGTQAREFDTAPPDEPDAPPARGRRTGRTSGQGSSAGGVSGGNQDAGGTGSDSDPATAAAAGTAGARQGGGNANPRSGVNKPDVEDIPADDTKTATEAAAVGTDSKTAAEAGDSASGADEAPVGGESDATAEEAGAEALVPEVPARRSTSAAGASNANNAIVTRMQEVATAPTSTSAVSAASGNAGGAAPSLDNRVNVDFREMDLVNVVALLASQAGINIIAGTDLTGTVTANLQNVPLRQAIETALRTNGLGMLEESGIYYIVPYEQAVAAQRETIMVSLENAEASEVQSVLEDTLKSDPDERLFNVSANETANIVVITGPQARLGGLVSIARDLDVAEPVLPTVTEAIKLNYADAEEMVMMVEEMLTPEIGTVSADVRGRHLVIKDVPIVVEQIRALVNEVDRAIKQVLVDAMIVDVTLEDTADTGVQWLLQAVQRQSRRNAALGPDAPNTGNLQDLGLDTDMTFSQNPAAALTFGVLTGNINWNGVIQAEVRNDNGRLVSNPVLTAMENTPAKISISQEIPYVELKQTGAGGSQTTTEFKEVGTVLQVTPTVTHDDHIMVLLQGKESGTAGEFNGIPIEDKRELDTNLRMGNGQTIFVGGLRKNDNNATVRKIPVLGDIPVVNFLFRSNQRREAVNELLIFLTCSVVPDDLPALSPYQAETYGNSKQMQPEVNAQGALLHDTIYPGESRDPVWRRTE